MKKILILISTALILLSFSSCNWDVWGGEFTDYGEGSAGANASTLFTGAKPEEISVTKSRFSDEIRIAWNSVRGADYYEIFKTEYTEGDDIENLTTWQRLTDTAINSTSYSDYNVVAGTRYAYRVRARSFTYRDVIGAYSDIGTGWTLTPPLEVEASQAESTTSITVSWEGVASVQGYKVYWSPTGYDGTWEATQSSAVPSTARSLTFSPTSQYYGQTLYFHVTSIARGNIESEPSVTRQGYTYVEGAPQSPENLSTNSGESTEEITLSWTAMYPNEGNYDWIIYRRAGNESERAIYSTQAGDDQPEVIDGMMTYTDTTASGLTPGVSYTYTVMAIGKITSEDGSGTQTVNGMPSTTTGYLLSPPTEISERRINDTTDGFVFTFLAPLGDDGTRNLTYNVYGKATANGSFSQAPIHSASLNGSESYTFEIKYSGDGDNEYFDIRVRNGSTESVGYASLYGNLTVPRPIKVRGYSASDNTYTDAMSIVDGQYQVLLQMDVDSNADNYTVKVWKTNPSSASEDADFSYEIVPTTSSDAGSNQILIDHEANPAVGETYYYAVRGTDKLGRTGEWSDIDSGYPAITGEELVRHMQVFGLKPWEFIDTEMLGPDLSDKWRNSAIYGYISQAGMGSLGSAAENGEASGRITYNASYSPPASGSVSFNYTNFGEKDYLYINGSYNMNVSMSGDGSASGGFTVGGMYPTTIGLTNIYVTGQKFAGTYTVTQSNGSASQEIDPNPEVQ